MFQVDNEFSKKRSYWNFSDNFNVKFEQILVTWNIFY